MLVQKNIMREELMGRHYLFWLRPEWAASCDFVDRALAM